ncbi:putative HTH-type transcriptional regulator YdfH [Aquisphaera giovannonii]|uniref:Putative HTH-type transcriptional regulator YdfH n=1 Tax=Aquisphaera giovannonii TaxID=406548 RepID=A0A5B9W7Y0_9BACT|nr:GntR family transcriptional regulator [Aquisphaera giovannonii]QEH36195.1 putative HTH-type transcriptional regulator YdfH [Aquisphaera giovannonii]
MKVVKKDCIRDQIRRVIAERILGGVYRPGDRLVELQIAREFGVSQGPVREAFLELEGSRLVECGSYRGTRVRSICLRELREAYQARAMIEQEAAPAAARHFRGNVEGLRKEHEAIMRAAEAGDLAEVSKRNSALHRLILEGSGNSVLLRLWESLSFETLTFVRVSRPDGPECLMRTLANHVPIIDALEAGDGELAGRLLREHSLSILPPDEGPCDEEAPAPIEQESRPPARAASRPKRKAKA